jgi:hypothetical protein
MKEKNNSDMKINIYFTERKIKFAITKNIKILLLKN